jgi:hypothetical protein
VTNHHKASADYFVVVNPKGNRRLWRWQIQRRPPTGVRICGEGFETEFEAKHCEPWSHRATTSSSQAIHCD